MLSERRADSMLNIDLGYSNCRFEDLHPEHLLKLMMLTEDIMLKREASRASNLGTSPPQYKYQGRDLHMPEGSKNKWHRDGEASKWQNREIRREIKSNATVASAGDIAELQEVLGDYQHTTKFFTKKNKVYCAPLREFAQVMSKHCDKNHYIDTLCNGGDAFKPTQGCERKALLMSFGYGEGYGRQYLQKSNVQVPRGKRWPTKSHLWHRSCSRSPHCHCRPGHCQKADPGSLQSQSTAKGERKEG